MRNVKAVETAFGGRFSGTRNMCYIKDNKMKYIFKLLFKIQMVLSLENNNGWSLMN